MVSKSFLYFNTFRAQFCAQTMSFKSMMGMHTQSHTHTHRQVYLLIPINRTTQSCKIDHIVLHAKCNHQAASIASDI